MRLTRRGALAGAAATAAGLSLPELPAARADQGGEALLASLSGLATLELTAVESYDLFVASGVATRTTRPVIERCRAFDLAHAHKLKVAIVRLGGTPPRAPNPADVTGLNNATSEPAALDFAIALEEQTLAAYLAVFRMISRRPLVRALAGLVTSDAQQLAVLRQLAGSVPAPSAFENGSQ